jgi:hypothetical protein
MVDVLVTNFHQPKSTLIMQVSAFTGHELIMRAYQELLKRNTAFSVTRRHDNYLGKVWSLIPLSAPLS